MPRLFRRLFLRAPLFWQERLRIKLMRLAFSPSTDTADNFVWLDVAHDFRRNVWLSKHANLVLRNDLHPMKKSIYIYIWDAGLCLFALFLVACFLLALFLVSVLLFSFLVCGLWLGRRFLHVQGQGHCPFPWGLWSLGLGSLPFPCGFPLVTMVAAIFFVPFWIGAVQVVCFFPVLMSVEVVILFSALVLAMCLLRRLVCAPRSGT